MKVIQLQSNNVMRLQAVDITPEGNLVMVGGKNGAGKSSVLNSIAMALGGKDLAPIEPIRNGETEASIKLDLGDLIVTRTFKRAFIRKEEDKAATADNFLSWGETESSLIVTNKDGARYPSPQAMLNKMLSNLTFDPLAFKELDPKPQDEVLRKLMKIDTTQIDAARKAAYEERTIQHKTRDIKMAQLIKMPKHDDAPAEEVSFDVITAQLKEAERIRGVAEGLRIPAEQSLRAKQGVENALAVTRAAIKEREEQLIVLRASLDVQEKDLARVNTDLLRATGLFEEASRAVPDTEALRAKLTEANEINAKVRDNQAYEKASHEVIDVENRIEELNYAITTADEDKRKLLEAAKFPVDGLGLSDTGVMFNGVPLSQASTAEQLRVSVAIGLALNTNLKVLLIRSGNLLDEDSLKLVALQAEAADAQVWMEYVTSDPKAVQIMIEDGHVRA
jgi:DNA repair exonuclease SbcCD ATPase subunit